MPPAFEVVQGNQQRALQKPQAEHKVEAELGREGIALKEGGEDSAAGLVNAGVVDGDRNKSRTAKGKSVLNNGLEQIFGLPGGTRMESIVGTPVLKLMAECAQSPGEGTAAEGGEQAKGLAQGALEGTLLMKSGTPPSGDRQELVKQHRPPGFI